MSTTKIESIIIIIMSHCHKCKLSRTTAAFGWKILAPASQTDSIAERRLEHEQLADD